MTGKIITHGEPLIRVEKILTATAKAGMLVDVDNNDYKVAPSAGVRPVGWIGFEHTPYETRTDSIETPFVSGDVVAVVSGGNFCICALATGEGSTGDDWDIVAGDQLGAGTDGTLVKLTAGAQPVATALETISIEAAVTPIVKRIHVRSLI